MTNRTVRRATPPLFGALLVAALLAGTSACSESASTRPADVPTSHTQRKGSAWHAPGLRSPQDNCAVCHGQDLRGGANGEPSCFSCHGAEWT